VRPAAVQTHSLSFVLFGFECPEPFDLHKARKLKAG
jgi:hypothetical protein